MANEQEYTLAQQLRQAQNKNSSGDKTTGASSAKSLQPKQISVPGAIVFAAVLGFAFDLPVLLLTFIPVIGWIIGGLWAIFGKVTVLMWLAIKGHLNFDTIKKNWISLGLCLSLFVILFVLRQKKGNQLASGAMNKV